ncbi:MULTISPECIES: hypothetical protein [Halomonadaceae]|uniref:hypothetical protein n=1 Tax=Halomonadaceae TaxID=28256 RepID=UPI001598ADB8|nr:MULTISPECIES: hypothetical protein [Halomonas]QJQ93908.1 hypothetical protein HIO72_00430 [Halomonas sp. PA5]
MATSTGLDSVQGQLSSMLDGNSPLMKQAATMGKQQANQRGLLNSSMGIGASQGAMINAAMPAAQQDAGYRQTLGQMDRSNQHALGQMKEQHGNDMNQLYGTSTANAWGVMSNNITDIVAQSMDAINQIQGNSDISAENKTKMINQITSMRDTDIKFQQSLYSNLSGFLKGSGVFPKL